MAYTIKEIAHQALHTGYLTLESEEQLRFLLRSQYGWEDLNAFMALQQAAMVGQVKQESRERRRQQTYPVSQRVVS